MAVLIIIYYFLSMICQNQGIFIVVTVTYRSCNELAIEILTYQSAKIQGID